MKKLVWAAIAILAVIGICSKSEAQINRITVSTSLSTLTDVDTSAGIADNDFLIYDSASDKWVPGKGIDCVSTPVTTYAGDVTKGTNQESTIFFNSVTLVSVYGTLTTAPTTSPVIVDVNDLSGTIFTSAKLYFGPGEYNSLFSSAYTLVPPMDTDTVGFSSALTYDVDEVDDGNTAAGLVITECFTVD